MSNIINPYRYAGGGGGGFSNDYSVEFDGVDQYCDLGFVTPAETEFTWSAWIKTTDESGCLVGEIDSGGTNASTRGGILWSDSYWYFTMGDGTTYDYDNSTNSAESILDGEWHHVAKVIAGYDQTIYVDGIEDCYWTSSIEAGTEGTNNLSVGAWSGSFWFCDGKIDEVAFFTSALDSFDIEAIYNAGVPDSLSSYSPYGWWRMGDINSGSGTTIADQGSAGNDGTLTNSPSYSSDVPS